jgi:protein-S-isoprenylcysteine O-methyltransferase Ste14
MTAVGKTISLLTAALAAVVGGGALILFGLYLFIGFRSLVDLGLEPASALAWDAGLSALFFLQHSGMVRRPMRRRVARAVGEDLVGVTYTIASGTVLLACMALWQPVGEPLVSPGPGVAWAVRLLFLAAIAGFLWGVRALGSFDTFGLQPVLDRLRQRSGRQAQLAIRGPYRWVRHPLYLFSLVLFWAYPEPTADRLLFDLLWTSWVVVATILEERDLVAQFGDAFVAYQREVPMLLPWRLPAKT